MALWNDDPQTMLVAGHRGGRTHVPENTMTAFRWALDAGVDMIETDIRRTSDGKLVLMHDALVDRTTDGTGLVHEKTYAEFRALNAAAHMKGFAPEPPADLQELFMLTAPIKNMTLNLELKEYPHIEGESRAYRTCDMVFEMVADFGMTDRVIINTFSAQLMEYIVEKYGKRYKLHGYYPYFIMTGASRCPAEYLDAACLFHQELLPDGTKRRLDGEVCEKEWFDAVLAKGIEPWIGAGVKSAEDLKLSFDRGARLVTTDDAMDTLAKLRAMGLHK